VHSAFRFLIAGLTAALVACAQLRPQLVVATEAGAVRGLAVGQVQAFRGIPYAAPPVGEWRWRSPQPVTPWTGVRAAETYAPSCAQPRSELWSVDLGDTREDCLTLNVWTPRTNPGDRLPVMVWIHGGGYSQGSGNLPRLNSPGLARQGVVLVTVNYRLSLFGFLAHPALAASNPTEPVGNYGLMDTVAALRWVQRNIAAFGGDPGNVTIFGESAGAGLVNYLMVMPSARGLFHRAISQSASVGLVADAHLSKRAGFQASGFQAGEAFVEKTGAAGAPDVTAALRAMGTAELLNYVSERDRFTPVVDGPLIPDHVGRLFAAGRQARVPYITGGNSWEASLGRAIGGGFSPAVAARLVGQADRARLYPGLDGPALDDEIFGDLIIHSASAYLAGQQARAGMPVYRYYLSYVAADRRQRQPGAAHTDDIAFVMASLDAEADLSIVTERDREISALLSAYWVQFAKTGDPNRPGLPAWPAAGVDDAPVLEVGDQIVIRDEFMAARMDFHTARGRAMLQQAP
jgi:para-nitrobenzyl esterase